MANRYIRHGATFCGDGTSKELATVNGGVGAWNTITYFEGATPAYGTLPAGTTVFIRSKDEAGSDITITSATAKTLGAGAGVGTELLPISWVVDDGSVWSSVSGVVTYNLTGQTVGVALRDFNNFISSNYNLILQNSHVNMGYVTFLAAGKCNTKDIKVDCSASVGTYGPKHTFNNGVHSNLWIRSFGKYTELLACATNNVSLVLINPRIELLSAAYTYPIISSDGNIGCTMAIYGGEVFGPGAADGIPLCRSTGNPGALQIFGLKYPRGMPLCASTYIGTGAVVTASGGDGALGNAYWDYAFAMDSRSDGYYPTLNATLEISDNAAWSYKVYPYRASTSAPVKVVTSKVWTQAAAIKTVTAEILWPTTLTAPTKDKVWITIQYTSDATGLKVHQSSQLFDDTALSASTAGWSATTYGATAFDKYKLSLTTLDAVKQDTEVIVTLFSGVRSVTQFDLLFVCPDPTFS